MKQRFITPKRILYLLIVLIVGITLHSMSKTHSLFHSGSEGLEVAPRPVADTFTHPAAPGENEPKQAAASTGVRDWLALLHAADDGSPVFKKAIANLENLLAAEVPARPRLLPNYPNPFNPETWIPYQLATPAEVTVSIHAADGRLVRTLALGHQAAGAYESKSRAAYWNGRNGVGERVASGVYFYTLTAGEFTATRKMLILK